MNDLCLLWVLIMTLTFSSFSIKDILTGRDCPGRTVRDTQICAKESSFCGAQNGGSDPDVCRQDTGEKSIQTEKHIQSDDSSGEEVKERGTKQTDGQGESIIIIRKNFLIEIVMYFMELYKISNLNSFLLYVFYFNLDLYE